MCKLSILYYRTKCWGSSVPDERLDKLTQMYNPQKVTHAVIEFVDIAGLVKGASKGEGLGNKFFVSYKGSR